ncbi:cytochrome b/b6 domain-containing protein [Albimonas sp. CAU 1670]|uniref:cytochrome b/b6 domain-containing protein n=1 Tax=Albimonas sp. CAU 1670 TaxID=3032599 RepID=UPI0023DB29F2|nr:cytochrome b/b6 domain-containing protein [Albimonas sp. CAU 1670]MDF2232237.1 cytochrome b/b6 domain-containing protein [Albimonas sp. CAU 1670]
MAGEREGAPRPPSGAAPAAPGAGGFWSLGVRVFHWSLVTLFALNFLILDEESALHEWAGFGVGALLAFRLVYGLVGPRRARFASFPPSLSAAADHARALLRWRPEARGASHNPLGALMVWNLLATLAVIVATGVMMTTDAFWGVEWVEEVHEAAANWAALSVLVHVAGVATECLRSGTHVIGDMLGPWAERMLIGRGERS